jgi:hypothetical protein
MPTVKKASGRCVQSAIAFLVCAILAAGCRRVDEIRRYQAPKSQATSRMLGAIILHGQTAWFFKATGPEEAVAEQADAFRQLIASVRFVDSKPQWTLPEGWRKKPASGIRFATLEFGLAGNTVELSITPLAFPGEDHTAYVLYNVNRWRDQMQLPEIGIDELGDHTERIELEEAVATLVDLAGRLRSGGMGLGHFRSGAGGDPDSTKPGQTEKR